MAKFYITTAIDYVNAKPHIGHAYEKICADVLARWHRLKGEDVHFLTGTDENAQKNEKAAREAGIPVKEFVDMNAGKFLDLCKRMSLSNDDFIRTTEERHLKVSRAIFKKLFEKGDIYKGTYEGLYCVGCEEFKTEKDLVDGKCPEHKREPELLREEAYFFRMSKYTGKVLELLQKPGFVLPESRRNEMVNRVKEEGLKDLCVSRTGLVWGIDTPIDPKFKIYVWIDALVNYVSALGYPDGRLYKEFWPADMHLIGKGINWFHTVIWPSILISAGIPLPKSVFVHGYVNVEGTKISKTGISVDPVDLMQSYGSDALRYYLLKAIPFGEDGDFSEEALRKRLNGELAADLGNLLNRVLTLVERFDGKIEGEPEMDSRLDFKAIGEYMEKLEIHLALDRIWDFVRSANKYMNEQEPWNLKGKELGHTLYNLLESLRVMGILLNPFIPQSCEEINRQLGVKAGTFGDLSFGPWKGKVKKGKILFEKVKEPAVKEEEVRDVKVRIGKGVRDLGINVKAAVISGVKVKKKHSGLERLKKEILDRLKGDVSGEKNIRGFRELYKRCGAKAEQPLEKLLEISKKAGKLPTINTVVDSYNMVAVSRLVSMGAHDADKISGDVVFKIADGTESWTPLGTSSRQKVGKGEYLCMDGEKVMCRLDVKQGDETKIGSNTRNVFVYVQGNKNVSNEELDRTLKEACENIIRFCGGIRKEVKVI